MKTRVLIFMLTVSCYSAFGQGKRTTCHPDELWGKITSVYPCDSPGFTLNYGQTCYVDFEITDMENSSITEEEFYMSLDTPGHLTCAGSLYGVSFSFSQLPYHNTIKLADVVAVGTHKVYLNHSGDDMAVDVATVTVRRPTGITHVEPGASADQPNSEAKEPAKIFPNPNSGVFTIHLSTAATESAKITVTNIVGEKVIESNILTNKDEKVQLNVSPGIYFINCQTPSEKWSERLVVSR
jgi:hypothetical protein